MRAFLEAKREFGRLLFALGFCKDALNHTSNPVFHNLNRPCKLINNMVNLSVFHFTKKKKTCRFLNLSLRTSLSIIKETSCASLNGSVNSISQSKTRTSFCLTLSYFRMIFRRKIKFVGLV